VRQECFTVPVRRIGSKDKLKDSGFNEKNVTPVFPRVLVNNDEVYTNDKVKQSVSIRKMAKTDTRESNDNVDSTMYIDFNVRPNVQSLSQRPKVPMKLPPGKKQGLSSHSFCNSHKPGSSNLRWSKSLSSRKRPDGRHTLETDSYDPPDYENPDEDLSDPHIQQLSKSSPTLAHRNVSQQIVAALKTRQLPKPRNSKRALRTMQQARKDNNSCPLLNHPSSEETNGTNDEAIEDYENLKIDSPKLKPAVVKRKVKQIQPAAAGNTPRKTKSEGTRLEEDEDYVVPDITSTAKERNSKYENESQIERLKKTKPFHKTSLTLPSSIHSRKHSYSESAGGLPIKKISADNARRPHSTEEMEDYINMNRPRAQEDACYVPMGVDEPDRDDDYLPMDGNRPVGSKPNKEEYTHMRYSASADEDYVPPDRPSKLREPPPPCCGPGGYVNLDEQVRYVNEFEIPS